MKNTVPGRWIILIAILFSAIHCEVFAEYPAWLSKITLVHADGRLSSLTPQELTDQTVYQLEDPSDPSVKATLNIAPLPQNRTRLALQTERTTAKRLLLHFTPRAATALPAPSQAIPFSMVSSNLTLLEEAPASKVPFDLAGLTTKLAAFAIRPLDGQAILIDASPSDATIDIEITPATPNSLFTFDIYSGPKDAAAIVEFDPNLQALFYSGLWEWLRLACFGVSAVMDRIYELLQSWALTILVLAFLVRIIIYPAARYGMQVQEKHKAEMARIKPLLDEAKVTLKGQKLHEKTMKIYEEHGISPLDGMKGLLPLFLQIPFFIIMYAVISEEVRLSQASFLWASDLTQPDRLFTVPFSIPLLGNSLNLFPIMMGIITIISSRLQASDPGERKSLYLMAGLFTVLFYNFPAGLVMYWTLSNLLQLIHQLARQRLTA